MVSAFRGAIEFFDRLGIYDVVLPFLLIFTIFFAILERTKIFGEEKVGEKTVTKKNLNAMTAFVIALLVVASSQIVAVINQALAQIALLLVVSISFLILAGSFFVNEEFKLGQNWKTGGMALMAIGILLIFANAVGWLTPFWAYITANWSSTVVGSIVLIVLIIWFVYYITTGAEEAQAKPEEEKKGGTTT